MMSYWPRYDNPHVAKQPEALSSNEAYLNLYNPYGIKNPGPSKPYFYPGISLLIIWIMVFLLLGVSIAAIIAPDYVHIQIQPVVTIGMPRAVSLSFGLWQYVGKLGPLLPLFHIFRIRRIQHNFEEALGTLLGTRPIVHLVFVVCGLENYFLQFVGLGCTTATVVLFLSRMLIAGLVLSCVFDFCILITIIVFWFFRRTLRIRSVILFLIFFSPSIIILGGLPIVVAMLYGLFYDPRGDLSAANIAYWFQPSITAVVGTGTVALIVAVLYGFVVSCIGYYLFNKSFCFDCLDDVEMKYDMDQDFDMDININPFNDNPYLL